MRYSIASVLSIATMASALAIAPRADYGSWAFTGQISTTFGLTTSSVTATYSNSELAEPIKVTCSKGWHFNANGTVSPDDACSDDSFTYDFAAGKSEVVTLSQVITVNGEQTTVKGSAVVDFTQSDSGTGFSYSGEGTIPVTSAVA